MLRFALVVALAVPALVSQAAIGHANNNNLVYADNSSMGGPNLLLAVKTTIPTAFVASRIEWFTGERAGLSTVSIWSHDAASNQPLAPLASGAWQMGYTNTWQGAPLTTPLPLAANDVVWVVWGPQNGSQSSSQAPTGGTQPYRGSFDGGTTWNGPFQGVVWKFRIWSGPAGHYESYGAGCSGTAGVPRLSWFGLPMTGTNWNVQIARGPASGVALLAIGDSDSVAGGVPLPLNLAVLGAPACNLLTSFPVTLATPLDVTGESVLTLALPANPAIIGLPLFNQWFVLDPPANAFGFTVSNGGKAVVGG